MVNADAAKFSVAIPDSLMHAANGYLRVDVLDEDKPRPAQFHIRAGQGGMPRLVGVVH